MNFVRSTILNFARQLLGVFYQWGGAGVNRDGSFGFDCSGFVIFLLRGVSLLPERGDWTAHQLHGMFRRTLNPQPGDLIFYGTEQKVKHVMVYLGDGACIGATGGDSRTRTPVDARGRGAMVKVCPVGYRKDFLGYGDVLNQKNGGGQ